jgi:hypothetical protein
LSHFAAFDIYDATLMPLLSDTLMIIAIFNITPLPPL